MRRFAERLELPPDDDGLVDIGGDSPAWPAPSSLLAMAWARPEFVPRRVLPPLPAVDSEAVVVIAPDGAIVVHTDEDLLVFGLGLLALVFPIVALVLVVVLLAVILFFSVRLFRAARRWLDRARPASAGA